MKHETMAFLASRKLNADERQVESDRLLSSLSARPVPVADVRLSWLVVNDASLLVATFMEAER